MKSIDIKSLLIGILGTALVMVLMGVTHSKGNYQIACSNDGCRILNTNTGVVKSLIPGEMKNMPSWVHPYNKRANF